MKAFRIAFLKVSFFCVIMTMIGLSSCSQNKNENTPIQIVNSEAITNDPFLAAAYDWPHSNSDIEPDPRVKFGRLTNGMRYAILPVPDEKGTVSIQMNVSAGFNDEPEGLYGIAHILEHMAFRGARGDTEDTIVHDLQKIGAGFGYDLNGFTDTNHTFYRVNLVSNKHSDINIAFKNFSQLVINPNLTKQHLEQEKKVVLAELKLRDTLNRHASQDAKKFRYPNRKREETVGIGTKKSLENITLEDVNVFFKTHYIPEKVLLVIAGDVNVTKTEKHISQLFSKWETEYKHTKKPIKENEINFDSFPPLAAFKKVGAKTQLNAIENTPPSLMNDVIDYRKKIFAEDIALSIMRTRLKPRIEATHKVSWINFSKTREKDYDIRSVTIGANDYPRAMTYFEEESLRAIKYGFTSEDIEHALKKMETRLENLAQRPAFIDAWSEASRLRKSFNRGEVYSSHLQRLELFKSFSKTTTAEDYHNAVKDMWEGFTPRYWTQSNTSMSEIVREVKTVRQTLAQSEILPPKSLDVETFQKAEFEKTGVIVSRDTIKSDDVIHRLLYKNGTRLNHRQRKTEPDNIEIMVTLNRDLPAFIDHYSAIAERAGSFTRADIKGVTKSEMDRTFLGQETRFYLGLKNDNLIIGSSTRPQDLEAALNVITKFIIDADFHSQDYRDRYKNLLSDIKSSSKNSPVVTGTLKIPATYSASHNAFRSDFSGLYPKPVMQDTIKHIRQIIELGTIEVGIIGDFEPEILEDIFAKSIGALPKRKAPLQGPIQKHSKITHIDPGVTSLTYRGTNKQMAVFYCWPMEIYEDSEKEAIRLLSSKIVQNRLMEKFRNELGVTYSPQLLSNSNPVFPNFSYDCFAMQITPDEEEVVHENFRNVVNNLGKQPITKTELTRAREPIISLFKRYLKSNKAFVPITAIAYSKPDEINRHKMIIPAVEKVRLKTLNSIIAKRYDKTKLHVFRVQHYQNKAALKNNTMKVKSAMGDASAQVEFGNILMRSSKDEDWKKALQLFEGAASQGNLDAHFGIGKYYALLGNKPELAVKHLELANDSKEGAYLLGNLYFKNPKIFPDVSDARIMELFKLSAESGFSFGQSSLAQRYKDGSITKRNEIEALKWALISRGKNTNMESTYIRGFTKNLSEIDQQKAQTNAKEWIKNHSNRK